MDKKDTEKAKEYLLKSATQGFSHAQASLGILLVNEHAYAEGLCWLETAVQKVKKGQVLNRLHGLIDLAP